MAQDPYCIRVLQYQIKFYQFISKKKKRNSMESINLAKAIIEGYLIFIIITCVTSNNFIFFF